MVTNSLTFVDKADLIVVLDKEEICESGSFSQLISHEGPFAAFLREHLKKKMEKYDSDDRDEDDEKYEEEIISKLFVFFPGFQLLTLFNINLSMDN